MVEGLCIGALGLCWGSFLNSVGHRMLHNESLVTMRPHCSSCKEVSAWYDVIPVLSWFIVRGRCRSCSAAISYLYPLIEITMGILTTALFYHVWPHGIAALWPHIPFHASMTFVSYMLFFSALLVGSRTDLQAMVVYQATTVWLIPWGVFAAYEGWLTISCTESIIGLGVGFCFLWLISLLFKYAVGKDGLGFGDVELIAMIGSFLGPLGVLYTIMIGSFLGLFVGVGYLFATAQEWKIRIPFVPFLALGASLYFFFQGFFIHIYNW
jgi:leader peptidase (prepilin peptidase)/N-methyltransferase